MITNSYETHECFARLSLDSVLSNKKRAAVYIGLRSNRQLYLSSLKSLENNPNIEINSNLEIRKKLECTNSRSQDETGCFEVCLFEFVSKFSGNGPLLTGSAVVCEVYD